ncbi:MAG TPA: MmgE/PrpD family protein, partial [Bacteroidia bacterium]
MTKKNLQSFRIAEFALSRRYSEVPSSSIEQLKKHLLDSLASMIHCLHKPSLQKLSAQLATLSDGGDCAVPLLGKLPVDRAAQFYTALIRYPDFMDNFLGKEATCHPCDNIGGLLAVSQRNDGNGRDFLAAMAIAYEIECRLVKEIPVMLKGFDHTLLLAYSLTAACARLMRLTEEQTAHAIAIAGCTFNPLVSCRASYTYEWKGFLSSMVAMGCVNAVFLAKNDMTGPISIFEGNKGFQKEFGMELDYDWRKDHFDLIPRCILKNYNSEVHSQSLIEAALELQKLNEIPASKIRSVGLTTFLTAYH